MLGSVACPPALGISVAALPYNCGKKPERIVGFLLASPEITTVILTSYGGYILDTSVAADHLRNKVGPESIGIDGHFDMETKTRLFEQGMGAAVASLLAAGKTVYWLRDVPEFPFFPKSCLVTGQSLRNLISDSGRGESCSIARSEVTQRQARYDAVVDRVGKSNPKLRILDPKNYLRNETYCPVIKDNILLYKDSHHLSERGGQWLAERMKDEFPQ